MTDGNGRPGTGRPINTRDQPKVALRKVTSWRANLKPARTMYAVLPPARGPFFVRAVCGDRVAVDDNGSLIWAQITSNDWRNSVLLFDVRDDADRYLRALRGPRLEFADPVPA